MPPHEQIALVKLIIPGRPVPAVRMTQRGKFVKPEAQRYLQYKEAVGWAARAKFKQPLKCQVGLKVQVYVAGRRIGDLDNIVKSIQDGLNKIAWHDDRQVVRIEAERLQGKPERAEVIIWEVEEAVPND